MGVRSVGAKLGKTVSVRGGGRTERRHSTLLGRVKRGQYGEMRPLTVGGRRGAAVYIRPDVDALGEDIARRARIDPLLRDSIVYLTCVHELGHAARLAPTDDIRDIMQIAGFGGDIVEFFERYRRQLRTRNDIATNRGHYPMRTCAV